MAIAQVEVEDEGVEGNSRLTATSGAVLFVLLAVEGVTVLSVRSMLRLHVLIGMMLVPVVVLKIGSTAYRALRYYLGDTAYVRRGAPPALLRLLGPVVVVLSAAVLATGVMLLFVGQQDGSLLLFLHKASFVLWFAVMTVHVLGHIVETARVAPRDWTMRSSERVRGVQWRRVVLLSAVVLGLVLGLGLQSRADGWRNGEGHELHDDDAS